MRLLTWNVQWCRGLDGQVDAARIAAEARHLGEPDIACFQEVAANFPELPGSGGEDQFDWLEQEFAGYRAASAWGAELADSVGRPQRFGNLLLSRLPLQRVLRHALPWPATSEVPSMPRSAIEAVLETGFGTLRLLSTHLEFYSPEQRAAQVERLRELHAEACAFRRPAHSAPGPFFAIGRPASAVLCGDFNFPPEDPLHARLLEPFPGGAPRFVDAWQALYPRTPHAPTFRVHERREGQSPYCCDFFFVTEDLVPRLRSLRVDTDTQASDHQPLMLELG